MPIFLPTICTHKLKSDWQLTTDKGQKTAILKAHTRKKTLDVRIHSCPECGYTTTRDVAASQEVRNRGIKAMQRGLGGFPHERLDQDAVGQIVSENVCGLRATGSIVHDARFWWGTKQKTSIVRC